MRSNPISGQVVSDSEAKEARLLTRVSDDPLCVVSGECCKRLSSITPQNIQIDLRGQLHGSLPRESLGWGPGRRMHVSQDLGTPQETGPHLADNTCLQPPASLE